MARTPTQILPIADGSAPSWGELYGPAMAVRSRDEAARYLAALVRWSMEKTGLPEAVVRRHQLDQISVIASYFDHETRLRVEECFGCAHPLRGPAEMDAGTTTNDVWRDGYAAGLAAARGNRSRTQEPSCRV